MTVEADDSRFGQIRLEDMRGNELLTRTVLPLIKRAVDHSDGRYTVDNIVDGLLDDDGSVYRRGGSRYKSNAEFSSGGLRLLWDGFLPPFTYISRDATCSGVSVLPALAFDSSSLAMTLSATLSAIK